MVVKEVKILGLDELRAKLPFDVLVQPELDDAVQTVTSRMLRGGKGAGVRNNTLLASYQPLGATVQTTRIFPRTKGTAWARYQEKVVKGIVAVNAVKKAIERIEARWRGGP